MIYRKNPQEHPRWLTTVGNRFLADRRSRVQRRQGIPFYPPVLHRSDCDHLGDHAADSSTCLHSRHHHRHRLLRHRTRLLAMVKHLRDYQLDRCRLRLASHRHQSSHEQHLDHHHRHVLRESDYQAVVLENCSGLEFGTLEPSSLILTSTLRVVM